MLISTQNSLPGVFILLFAILAWVLFFSIYFSNRHNRLNRWGFLAGMCFCSGIIKEYLYFSVVPALTVAYPRIDPAVYTQIYSVMTAILYYYAMPCVLILVFYYSSLDKKLSGKTFRLLQYLAFVPCILFAVFVPYWDTRYYQLYVFPYYLTVSAYNWCYGLIVTVLILRTLCRQRLQSNFRQQRLIAVNILLPMWYWLITAFLFHSLRLSFLFKAWQGNLFIISFLVIYYFYNAFHDGMWGIRLKKEHYDWLSENQMMERNTAYIEHTLKNEMNKIDWCLDTLDDRLAEPIEELSIIRRSVSHLNEFLRKSHLITADTVLHITVFPLRPVLERCVEDCLLPKGANISFEIDCAGDAQIRCDREHLVEMVNNILNNAVDVLSRQPEGHISLHYVRKKRHSTLSVTDNGSGMSKEEQRQIFRPYYTTKSASSQHYGLGLYYCYHVMEKLNGQIRVKSLEGKGTTFSLDFPMPLEKRSLTQTDKAPGYPDN